METNGSHLSIWDPNGPQSPSDFEFLWLKAAAAAQLTAALSQLGFRAVLDTSLWLAHCAPGPSIASPFGQKN